MRVPVSIVVRMNSASNMMAKWYQYFMQPSQSTPVQRNASVKIDGHADGQRHRPAGPAAERLAADLLLHLGQVELLHVRRRPVQPVRRPPAWSPSRRTSSRVLPGTRAPASRSTLMS